MFLSAAAELTTSLVLALNSFSESLQVASRFGQQLFVNRLCVSRKRVADYQSLTVINLTPTTTLLELLLVKNTWYSSITTFC